MNGFIDDLMKSIGGDLTKEVSNELNINKSTVEQLIPQIAPLIVGGLKRQKDEHGGAARVDHILNKYGSANILDDLHGAISSKAKEDNPDPNLGGLLGAAGGDQAVNFITDKFKLDSGTIMKLIPLLSPVILGFLSKKRDQEGLGSAGIASLLDQDGDGSVIDDVAGFLLQGFGEPSQKKSGGLLGNLLGGLLGGKRR